MLMILTQAVKVVPEAAAVSFAIVFRRQSRQIVNILVIVVVIIRVGIWCDLAAQLLDQVLVQVLPVALDGRAKGLVVERVILQLGVFVVVAEAVFVAL